MKLIKRLFKILIVLMIAIGALTFYSFRIEPFRLRVNEYDLNKVNESQNVLRVVQISDLHIKPNYTVDNLARVVDEVNELEADLVIFTGDLYDNYSKYNDDSHIIAQLQRIQARHGKIAIWGNRDYGGGAMAHYENIMSEGGFDVLKNEHRIFRDNGKQVLITGLDDKLLGNSLMPEIDSSLSFDYKLLLSHEPDIVDYYLDYGYHLSLSGHSHGGQINIPFLPFINKMAVSNTEFATKYISGFYSLADDDSQVIYVNVGLGTTHISARLGVVPEISVFNIYI